MTVHKFGYTDEMLQARLIKGFKDERGSYQISSKIGDQVIEEGWKS